ncbi:hypothetical protein M0L20_28285 [Spirosoma sp. RP8]|uniref:Uncharacterized protein n=1 Tax=Spirosoma liriopis TaxID=2937440 RepID=A0ABT0HUB2_9BACT|nr:hypothetical protein [Spirosoma liriopis]MCK8495798.1 hypothetical protein [Spirosoma liriopis]
MNNTFILLLLGVLLVETSALAQQDPGKVYTARVVSTTAGPVSKRDKDEITFQARSTIDNLRNLLNTLNTTGLTESEQNPIIQNSYLPNQDQLFYNDAIVVEDDIDPKHNSSDSTADFKVDRYLRNLILFYTKSDVPTIEFSRIVTSPVLEGKEYPYIKIFFTSAFTGKHTQIPVPYQPVQRVAELRAEKMGGKWRTYIIRLGFVQPGEGLTAISAPVIAQRFETKPKIRGNEFLYRSTNGTADSVTVTWDQRWLNVSRSSTKAIPIGFFQRSAANTTSQERLSILLTDQDKLLTFRRVDGTTLVLRQIPSIDYLTRLKRAYQTKGWIQIIAGVTALGTSYAGYSSLQRSYDAYAGRFATLNADYAVWQTLSQQPGTPPAAAMPFNTYAQPGIYAVYGGSLVGSGLIINGIRYLLKAGKVKAQLDHVKTQSRN